MRLLIVVCGFLLASPSFAAADDVLGTWLANEGGGHVLLYRNGDVLEGKIVGAEAQENRETKDVNNPNPSLRERELLGLVIITGMRYNAEDDVWEDGKLYRNSKGKTYHAKLRVNDDGILKVTGYLGFFKKTVDWHRLAK